MRIVLDTNVFISGVFFGGTPGTVLQAWRSGEISLVVSKPILEEYERVGSELSKKFRGLDLYPLLLLVGTHGEVVQPHRMREHVCSDPDDDKFLACAIGGKCRYIVSGDKGLLKVSGYGGIEVLKPRAFVERYL